jgi:hypothetical protein
LNDTVTSASGAIFPANDPACVAWAAQSPMGGNRFAIDTWERLDPDHIVNEELYIHNRAATPLHYLIVCEPYTMSEDEGVLQLVKNKQQS